MYFFDRIDHGGRSELFGDGLFPLLAECLTQSSIVDQFIAGIS